MAGIAGLTLPMSAYNKMAGQKMGIVVHSYATRWNSKVPSSKYPGFVDATELIRHSASIGAGGVQVGVNGWAKDFAKKVRDVRENSGLFLEGSIGLPGNESDLNAFETSVVNAKEAGATILRTVCASGRRYEVFKSLEEYNAFRDKALQILRTVEPVLKKHQVRLAIENHKDWRAFELREVLQQLSSEWIGVTLDFGNSIALMEDPMEVVNTLAPYVVTTHIKDMAVEEYPDGFLLSEVPLGEGFIDLNRMFEACRKNNPKVNFNLEMITRDPLQIPCLKEEYWATFKTVPGIELAHTLSLVRQNKFKTALPRVAQLAVEERLDVEEKNIVSSISYGRKNLGLS
jgi:sugar phosphate isomerase/epimerase